MYSRFRMVLTADAEFFQFLHQAGLGVARGVLGPMLGGIAAFHGHQGALGQVGQHALGLFLVVVVGAFHVYFQEAVELHLFTAALERQFGAADANLYLGLLQFGVGHLAGYGALPDQFVQSALGALGIDALAAQVGRTNGFVGFLCAFGLGLVAAHLVVFGAIL